MTPLKRHRSSSFIFISLLLLLTFNSVAQRTNRNISSRKIDTTKVDSTKVDSLSTDSVQKKKKSALDAPVAYEANDSIVFTEDGFAHLFGAGKVNYEKIELTADAISMNMDSSTVFARGVKDSTGVEKGTPVFKDGETPYESKEMRYNFKTKKGFINNIVTQQGEGYITSQESKKNANDEIFLTRGRYTTCDNHAHPHFYLQLSMAKVKPKKNAVFGPANLVVGDVPLPIAIPFGFFPFTSSYSSGFIMPTYGYDNNRGFYLRDGGYYFAISDKMDLKVLGELFTKGSWGLSAQSNYNKRYKYSGSFNGSYMITKTGEQNLPDYSVTKDFRISWSHRQDQKANPNSTFSANVNFATSSYDRRSLSSLYNPQQFSNHVKTSSVNYSRTFPDIGLTLSSTFNIEQNTKDSAISVRLPDLDINLARLYPFKRKKAVGQEKWYEKISVQYTGRLTNSIRTKDNLILKKGISSWTNGMQHSIPVSATFNLFKYINVVPSLNYTERWYLKKLNQNYNQETQTVEKTYENGFYRVYNYDTSLDINTKLYGFYKPWKKLFGDKIEAIRHVVTPRIGFSYSPDFGSLDYGYYGQYSYTDKYGQVDSVRYSHFEGAPFGVPGSGRSGVVNFGIDNNIEMKVKSDKDSTGVKKISLIDQLSANISYNTAAKYQPWSDLSMNLRLKLTKSYTFNMNASFATYAYTFDKSGNVIVGNRTEWSYGRFGRFRGYSGSFAYTLNNETWTKLFKKGDKEEDKEKKDNKALEDQDEETDMKDEENKSNIRKTENAKIDPDGYLAFKMPWSINLSYSYSIAEDRRKQINIKSMRYPYSVTHSLNVNGNIKLGSRWNISGTSGYDFNTKEVSMTSFNITRDLHCFTMSCGVVLKPFTSYNFSIRALSGMLTDALKWDQRSNTGSAVNWY